MVERAGAAGERARGQDGSRQGEDDRRSHR
jgi:hypothetical protein